MPSSLLASTASRNIDSTKSAAKINGKIGAAPYRAWAMGSLTVTVLFLRS